MLAGVPFRQPAILPLGILPSDVSSAKTQKDRAINRYLAACYREHPRVTYLDVGSIFYQQDTLRVALFYDPRLAQPRRPLHPDTIGQRMMAEAIEPALAKLMGDSPRVPLTSMTDINTAVIPVGSLETDSYATPKSNCRSEWCRPAVAPSCRVLICLLFESRAGPVNGEMERKTGSEPLDDFRAPPTTPTARRLMSNRTLARRVFNAHPP